MASLENLALTLNMTYDNPSQLVYGKMSGYHVAIVTVQKNVYQIVFSLAKNGNIPDVDDLQPVVKTSSYLNKVTVEGHLVTFSVKSGLTKSKTFDRIAQSLPEITTYLELNHFSDVCQVTGQPTTTLYMVGSALMFLSDTGLNQLKTEMGDKRVEAENTKEQFIPGLVGAFLGSLAGVAFIVILGQLGFVAAVSGIVMGLAIIKGYEWLGKKFTKKAVVAVSIVMLVMTYFAYRLDWAITIARVVEINVFDSFQIIPYLLESGDIDSGEYYIEMFKLYFFTLVGFVPTLLATISAAKTKFQMRLLP